MLDTDDWKVGDHILYNDKPCRVVGSNGSGSTFELLWPDGTRGYYESYGHGVTVKVIPALTYDRAISSKCDECDGDHAQPYGGMLLCSRCL